MGVIVNPSGTATGLNREFIAKSRAMKGFLITFQWVNGEPAMCLLRKANMRKSAYVICLSSAWKYADISFLVPTSAKIAAFFGMENERHAARAIADVILECLEDLVKLAPEPKEAEQARVGPELKPEFDQRTGTIVLH